MRSGDRQAKQEATAALLAAYHRGGDRDARARVIEQNLPLVRALARRFSRPGVQVASIGLIKAVDGYREERGRDLGAYAVPTIVGELRRHVRGTLPAAADGGRPGRSTTAIVDAIPDARSTAELERGETRALVHSGLRSLSRRERRIVAVSGNSQFSELVTRWDAHEGDRDEIEADIRRAAVELFGEDEA